MKAIRLSIVLALSLIAGLLTAASASADPPAMTAYPSSVNFGDFSFHSPSYPQQTITFQNDTSVPLFVFEVMAENPPITIISNNCNGGTFNPGEQCQVTIAPNPTAAGPIAGMVTLFDSSFFFEQVFVSGDARTATLVPASTPMNFSPAPWYYGSQYLGNQLHVNDYGVQFGSAQITGPDAALFSIDNDSCSNQTFDYSNFDCWFGVRFNPTGPSGPADATLTFNSDAENDPVSIPLHAEALTGPEPVISPSEFDFGPVKIGESSAPKTITVTNAGDFPMQIQQLMLVSGSSNMFQTSSDSCTFQTVNPGDDCSFDVTFTPTRSGERDVTALVISNSPGSVRQANIYGEGVASPSGTPVVTGTPRVGEELSCRVDDPNGSVTFGWLANGNQIGGADTDHLTLQDGQRDKTVRCRVTITNQAGSESFNSVGVGPIEERDLASIPGSGLQREACRTITLPALGPGVSVKQSSPVTPSSPIQVRAADQIKLRVGSTVREGRRITLTPRSLARNGDGVVNVSVNGISQGSTTISDCELVSSLTGGRNRDSKIQIAARRSLSGLVLNGERLRFKPRSRSFGSVVVRGAEGARESFPLASRKSRSNGITAKVGKRSIRIQGLPRETGRVSIRLRRGTVKGSGDSVLKSRASMSFNPGSLHSRVRAEWR